MAELKRRNSWLALFLSFVELGLGQLYNCQPRKTVILIVFDLVAAIVSLTAYRSFAAFSSFVLVILLVRLITMLDAFICARRMRQAEIRWYNRWYYYCAYIAVLSTCGFLHSSYLRKNLCEAFKVPSSSMEPSLEVGDHFIADKRSAAIDSPARGDVVVFTPVDDPATKENESEIKVIKRIIALPGERVEVRKKAVLINGIELSEPYAAWQLGGKKDFPEQVVPENKVFVLGDNRDYSKDSRFWPDPFVPTSRITGKALYIYWNAALKFPRIGNPVL